MLTSNTEHLNNTTKKRAFHDMRKYIFSWNLPFEVFDCFKVVALAPVAGGVVVRNTCAVHEIHITDIRKMKSLFPSLAN